MMDDDLLSSLLNSMKDPVVFVDTHHLIRYMNGAAIRHYDEGEALLGRSVMDCHNERSQEIIREIFAAMERGEEERMITDNEKHRIYMRAVRDAGGRLLGYFERYEPPRGEGAG